MPKWPCALAVACLAVPLSALAGGEPVALHIPARHACTGGAIRLGVEYTANPDGPRWYRVSVVDPRGRRVFRRHGLAPTSWRTWRYTPRAVGVFTTRYVTASGRNTFPTRVRACG